MGTSTIQEIECLIELKKNLYLNVSMVWRVKYDFFFTTDFCLQSGLLKCNTSHIGLAQIPNAIKNLKHGCKQPCGNYNARLIVLLYKLLQAINLHTLTITSLKN